MQVKYGMFGVSAVHTSVWSHYKHVRIRYRVYESYISVNWPMWSHGPSRLSFQLCSPSLMHIYQEVYSRTIHSRIDYYAVVLPGFQSHQIYHLTLTFLVSPCFIAKRTTVSGRGISLARLLRTGKGCLRIYKIFLWWLAYSQWHCCSLPSAKA